MNTDKTLKEKFGSTINDYPIWFYKELDEVDISYVIFNLLKETFVVELDNKKIVMTFGKNRKHEIGCTQSCHEGLDYTSYTTIEKAFKEGKWFILSDNDTSDSFKEEYIKDLEEKQKIELRNGRIDILSSVIEKIPNTSDEEKLKTIESLKNMSDEELENLTDRLFKSFKNTAK